MRPTATPKRTLWVVAVARLRGGRRVICTIRGAGQQSMRIRVR
jgi:hypothetical protein